MSPEPPEPYEFEFFEDGDGNCPVTDFLKKRPTKELAKLEWLLNNHLRPLGPNTHGDIFHPVEEFRQITFFQNRILCCQVPDTRLYVMLHGFLKKTPKTPEKEKSTARKYKLQDELIRKESKAKWKDQQKAEKKNEQK
jgi:Phage derived protein Gp49-like (DUF891)